MKIITKVFKAIAVGAIVAAGLSACISIAPAAPPSEEELALRNSLHNASWKREKLNNQPTLDGFEKISKLGYTDAERLIAEESHYFQQAAGDGESDAGRTITSTTDGGSWKTIGMDANTWYRLTAPEFPNVTYYFYREDNGGAISVNNIYKSKQ